jgi:hypothetical protein
MYKVVLTHDMDSIILKNNYVDGNILPVNIDELDNSYKRSEKYYGVLRSFGNSVRFVHNGAKFIENVCIGYGIAAVIRIEMYYSDTEAELWHQWYAGKLDLTTRKKNYLPSGGYEIEVNIVNGDFEDKLISNITSVYDVGKGGELFQDVMFRERNSIQVANYVSDYTITDPALNIIDPTNTEQRRVCIPRLMKSSAANTFNNSVIDFSCVNSIDAIDFCLFQSTAIANVLISCDLNFYEKKSFPATPHDFVIKAHIFNKQNNLKNIITLGNCTLIHSIPDAPQPNYTYYYYRVQLTNYSITIADGDKFYIAVSPTAGYLAYVEFYFKSFNEEFSNSLSLYISEAKPQSKHKAVSVLNAATELVRRATGESDKVISDILSTHIDWITTGELLRTAYDDEDINTKQINTSLDDLFNAINLPKCVGIGVDVSGFDKKLRLDHRSEFFKPVLVYDLGEVVNFSEEIAHDLFYTQAVFSYPTFKNEIINGLYEFNTKMRLNLPSNFNKNELTVSSPYRADNSGIEEARRTPLSDNLSTDTKYDNDLFLVSADIISGVLKTVRDEFMNSFSGIPDNTFTMNAAYYPPYALRFWAWWLLAGLQYYVQSESTSEIETGDYVFNKNFEFKRDNSDGDEVQVAMTDIIGSGYNWGYLLKIAKLQGTEAAYNNLFEPVLYNFDSPVTWQFINKFEAERHGVIKFSHNGVSYYGYGMTIPAVAGKISTFVLLKLSKFALSILE